MARDRWFALDVEDTVGSEERDELVEAPGVGVMRVRGDNLADGLPRDQFVELHSHNVAARSASAMPQRRMCCIERALVVLARG